MADLGTTCVLGDVDIKGALKGVSLGTSKAEVESRAGRIKKAVADTRLALARARFRADLTKLGFDGGFFCSYPDSSKVASKTSSMSLKDGRVQPGPSKFGPVEWTHSPSDYIECIAIDPVSGRVAVGSVHDYGVRVYASDFSSYTTLNPKQYSPATYPETTSLDWDPTTGRLAVGMEAEAAVVYNSDLSHAKTVQVSWGSADFENVRWDPKNGRLALQTKKQDGYTDDSGNTYNTLRLIVLSPDLSTRELDWYDSKTDNSKHGGMRWGDGWLFMSYEYLSPGLPAFDESMNFAGRHFYSRFVWEQDAPAGDQRYATTPEHRSRIDVFRSYSKLPSESELISSLDKPNSNTANKAYDPGTGGFLFDVETKTSVISRDGALIQDVEAPGNGLTVTENAMGYLGSNGATVRSRPTPNSVYVTHQEFDLTEGGVSGSPAEMVLAHEFSGDTDGSHTIEYTISDDQGNSVTVPESSVGGIVDVSALASPRLQIRVDLTDADHNASLEGFAAYFQE